MQNGGIWIALAQNSEFGKLGKYANFSVQEKITKKSKAKIENLRLRCIRTCLRLSLSQFSDHYMRYISLFHRQQTTGETKTISYQYRVLNATFLRDRV